MLFRSEAGTLDTATRDSFFRAGGVGERFLASDDSSDGVGWAPVGLDSVCSSTTLTVGASGEDSSSITLTVGASGKDSSSAASTVGASGEDSSSSSSSPAAAASLEDSSLDSSSSTVSAAAEVLLLPLSVSRADFQKESVSYKKKQKV